MAPPFSGTPTTTKRIERRGLSRRGLGFSLGGALLGLSAPAIVLAPSARAADVSLLAPEIKKIKDRGQLIVALTSFDSPPFYYARKNGQVGGGSSGLVGSDIQLALEIATSLDVALVLNRDAGDFNKVVDLVMKSEADIAISKLSLTVKRAIGVLFSRPTIELRHALLANRVSIAKATNGKEVQDVISRSFTGQIGVIADSSFVDTARQLFPAATLRELKTWDKVVDAVNGGAVDIAYRDELEIKRIMRLRPELHLNVRSVLISDKRDLIAVTMPYQSGQLASLVNVILQKGRRLDANQLLDEYSDIFAPAA
jgi:polar amino acid transport system substrate-binding protein